MWKVSKMQGVKNKWVVSKNGTLKGFATVDNDGKISGNIQLEGSGDTFKVVEEIQNLIGDELAEEQLLMSN